MNESIWVMDFYKQEIQHLASGRTFPYDVKEEQDGKEIPESEFRLQHQFLSYPGSEKVWVDCTDVTYGYSEPGERRIIAIPIEPEPKINSERILCAAIWYKDQPNMESVYQCRNITQGVVLCGFRHSNIIGQCVAVLGKKQYEMGEGVQGFLTSKGRFVDREEAGKIAVESKQISELEYSDVDLFSEDLY